MNSQRLWCCPTVIVFIAVLGLILSKPAMAAQSTPAADGEEQSAPEFFIDSLNDPDNQWFETTLEPGESEALIAGIQNSGPVPATVRAFVTNASSAPNGGFLPGARDEELGVPAQWIDYSTEEFTIPPGDLHQVEFSVTVPEDTEPGYYVAAFVVETTESFAITGTETFRQIVSNSVSVEIEVPGAMATGFELGDPVVSQVGDQRVLDVPITNTGTARLRPQGELQITTPEGEEVSATDVEMGSVYGGNTTSVRVALPGQLPAGEYLVSLDLTDEATDTSDSISDAPFTLAAPEAADAQTFVIEQASVVPEGDPIRYADVAATITNNGDAIPTANVTLNVQRDGEDVESYPLAENQALPQGTTEFSQRYVPADGWESGSWTFELIISAVSGGTETVLATVQITDEITVP